MDTTPDHIYRPFLESLPGGGHGIVMRSIPSQQIHNYFGPENDYGHNDYITCRNEILSYCPNTAAPVVVSNKTSGNDKLKPVVTKNEISKQYTF